MHNTYTCVFGDGDDDVGGGVSDGHDLSWCETTCHDLFIGKGEDCVSPHERS